MVVDWWVYSVENRDGLDGDACCERSTCDEVTWEVEWRERWKLYIRLKSDSVHTT